MPRPRSPNRDKAKVLWLESGKSRLLKDIAEELGVSETQVRKWKNQDQWDADNKVTLPNAKSNVTKQKESGNMDRPKKNRGNPNPKNQFTKRNQAARIHGLRAKYFTETQREIMDDFQEFSIEDHLWMQIEMEFSAIIQLQKVMWVEDAEDHLKEESGSSWGEGGSSESFKIAFAFERYEAYMRAQTRAMAEYRNLTKQFLELAHVDDERRLKLEAMQLDVDKKHEELEILKKENSTSGKETTIIVDDIGDFEDDD